MASVRGCDWLLGALGALDDLAFIVQASVREEGLRAQSSRCLVLFPTSRHRPIFYLHQQQPPIRKGAATNSGDGEVTSAGGVTWNVLCDSAALCDGSSHDGGTTGECLSPCFGDVRGASCRCSSRTIRDSASAIPLQRRWRARRIH